MILVDDRKGSAELLPIIQRTGAPCQLMRLEYGDACFEGNGPDGPITIGIERKTLHDMLACIEDSRYAAHQRPGMAALYSKSFLAIEGLWKCGDGDYSGVLIQGFNQGSSWGPLRTSGNRTVLYSKLYRYLVSVALSGVIITQSSSLAQTAYNIVELFGYFQKKWTDHTSLLEVQKLAIPVMNGRASLTRRWAEQCDDIGVKHGMEVDRYFKTPLQLATADETAWVSAGVSPRLAKQTVKAIRGWK